MPALGGLLALSVYSLHIRLVITLHWGRSAQLTMAGAMSSSTRRQPDPAQSQFTQSPLTLGAESR